jgi:hypothetical protein
MALTARQRNALPPSAFVHRPAKPKAGEARTIANGYRYPVPTKAQARKAGISETQRQSIHQAALRYSGRKNTAGTRGQISRVVKARKSR